LGGVHDGPLFAALAMKSLLHHLRPLFEGQPDTWFGFVLLGVAVLLSLVAVGVSLTRRWRSMGRTVLRYGVVPLAVTALCGVWWGITCARKAAQALLLPPELGGFHSNALDSALRYEDLGLALTQSFGSALWAAWGLAVLGAAAVIVSLRTDRTRIDRAVTITLAALALAIGVTVAKHSAGAWFDCTREGWINWRDGVQCRMGELEGMLAVSARGRVALSLIAAVGFALCARASFRPREGEGRVPRSTLIGSAATLAFGVAAFWLTRNIAHDVHHRVVPDWGAPCVPNMNVPIVTGKCAEPREGPLVPVGPRGIEVDGNLVPNEDELVTILAGKLNLWAQINPGRPRPTFLLVAAHRDTPIARILPALRAIPRSGYSEVGIVSTRPASSVTLTTLGAVPRVPNCCGVFFRIDDERGVAISGFGSWGEVFERVEKEPGARVAVR
jgi:hypothetical protein